MIAPMMMTAPAAGRDTSQLLVESLAALRQLAYRLTRNMAEADDLLQATCLRVLERAPHMRDTISFHAWAIRVMRNLHIDVARTPFRRRAALTAQALERLPAPEPAEPPPWRWVEDADVRAALGHVAPSFRDTWLLWADGLPYDEIARRLGIPRSTVSTRLLRARRQLRKTLEERLAAREAASAPNMLHGGNRQLRSPPCLLRSAPAGSADNPPALARGRHRPDKNGRPVESSRGCDELVP
jgi:RNA polymerase sigma-70 factor, ECF subfamily